MAHKVVAAFLLFICFITVAHAEDRALIIGIGHAYTKIGTASIIGPEKDIALAKEIARVMEFKSVKVVAEELATKANVVDGLVWVKEGVKAGGKALIYYSGHGCSIPDIEDPSGCDEALVPADAIYQNRLIIDKEIAKWLSDLNKAQVIFIVDSCFSGTITKSIYSWSAKNIKYAPFKEAGKQSKECGRAVNMRSLGSKGAAKETIQKNIIVLSAAANNEVAYGAAAGSGKGSMFTQALYDIIAEKGDKITFNELRDRAAAIMNEQCKKSETIPSTPQIDGDPELFDRYITLKGGKTNPGNPIEISVSNKELFEKIERNSKFMVAIRADKRKLAIGEKISFSVTSSEKGYLNIVEIEPNGNVNVLFPNKYVTSNEIVADKEKKIPQDIGGFNFKAREPVGKSQLYALVTKEPLNLFDEKGLGAIAGNFKSIKGEQFGKLRDLMVKSIMVEAEKPVRDNPAGMKYYGAGSVIFDVVK